MTISRDRRCLAAGASVVLALSASACHTWRAESRRLPAPFYGDTLPEIRVLTRQGANIAIHEARLVGDSILGLTLPRNQTRSSRIAVATSDVVEVMYHAPDGQISVIAGLAAVLAVLTFAAIMTCANGFTG